MAEPAEEGRVLYWVGNSGMADDPAHYSLGSGGMGGEPIPTEEDYLIIDHNSFTLPGQYIMFPTDSGLNLNMELLAGEGYWNPADIFIYDPFYSIATSRACTIACPSSPAVVTLNNHGLTSYSAIYFTVDSGQISDEIETLFYYSAVVIDNNTLNIEGYNYRLMDATGEQTANEIILHSVKQWGSGV